MRTTSGAPWSADGRWVVVGTWFEDGPETIIFDPHNADLYGQYIDPAMVRADILDCHQFVLDNCERPAIIKA